MLAQISRITRTSVVDELRLHSTKMTVIEGLIAIFDLKNATAVKRRPRTATHSEHARLCIVHLVERSQRATRNERATIGEKPPETWNRGETRFRVEPALINRSVG